MTESEKKLLIHSDMDRAARLTSAYASRRTSFNRTGTISKRS